LELESFHLRNIVHRMKIPPIEAAIAMRIVNVVPLAELELLPCLSGTTESEAATEEVRVTPGTIMVLTPPAPSSVVEVIRGGGEESKTNVELAWETEDEGSDEVEDDSNLLALVVEEGREGVDEGVVDTGSFLVDVGSTTEEAGRGLIIEPGPWGRGARFLIMVRFMFWP